MNDLVLKSVSIIFGFSYVFLLAGAGDKKYLKYI